MNSSKIASFRNLLSAYKLDSYILPSNDEYLSEYTPIHARRLEYITGFTGSSGFAIIAKDFGIFCTDGRYIEQSKLEIDVDIFEIINISEFHNQVSKFNFGKCGYDPKLFTHNGLKFFDKIPNLTALSTNIVDVIWEDRPAIPNTQIYFYPEQYAGEHYMDKVSKCMDGINTLVITAPDSLCWLLNLRGKDVEFSPLILGVLIIQREKNRSFKFTLSLSRCDSDFLNLDKNLQISLISTSVLDNFLSSLDGEIAIDPSTTSIFILDALKGKSIKYIDDPCILLKACKNNIEIQHMIDAHVKDGVVLCELLSKISEIDSRSSISEYDLSEMLTALRKTQDGYVMDSFPSICGFRENGAIIHYRPKKETAKHLNMDGILLIDSGGQYLGATTDVTRTVVFGEPTHEQKNRYTEVLKGHIALADIRFPAGISGSHLDVLARQFLWQNGLDYDHGTGHGVGSFLNVHEGPQSINLRNKIKLQEGMVLSNEPGYYMPHQFGIRIENLMYVKRVENSKYLEFTQLTLVPYAKNLINFNMLTTNEMEYIKKYYKILRERVYPILSDKAKLWFNSETDLLK